MATENLTTYTETDTEGDLTITATTATYTQIQKASAARCFDDKGAAHFDGDFEHLFEFKETFDETLSTAYPYAMTNIESTWYDIQVTQTDDAIGLSTYSAGATDHRLYLWEVDGGTGYNDSYLSIVEGTAYYLTIKRDEAVGDFGTIYCYIYSDASRETLVDTLSVTLHTSKKDFRYIYAIMGKGEAGQTQEMSGYTKDLDLQEGAPPVGQPTMRRWGGVPGMPLTGRVNW